MQNSDTACGVLTLGDSDTAECRHYGINSDRRGLVTRGFLTCEIMMLNQVLLRYACVEMIINKCLTHISAADI